MTRKHKNLVILIGILLVLILLGTALTIRSMQSRAKSIGNEIGKFNGQMVGVAVGSARGIIEGISRGQEDGSKEGLSAKDTNTDIQGTMNQVGKLEVLVAGVRLKNMNMIGSKYKSIYLVSGDAVFSVDLTKARIKLDEGEKNVYIEIPEPAIELFINQNSMEKLAESQKISWNVSAEEGFTGYLNSMKNTVEKVKESLVGYESLMTSAKEAAQDQIQKLLSIYIQESQSIQISFKENTNEQ